MTTQLPDWLNAGAITVIDGSIQQAKHWQDKIGRILAAVDTVNESAPIGGRIGELAEVGRCLLEKEQNVSISRCEFVATEIPKLQDARQRLDQARRERIAAAELRHFGTNDPKEAIERVQAEEIASQRLRYVERVVQESPSKASREAASAKNHKMAKLIESLQRSVVHIWQFGTTLGAPSFRHSDGWGDIIRGAREDCTDVDSAALYALLMVAEIPTFISQHPALVKRQARAEKEAANAPVFSIEMVGAMNAAFGLGASPSAPLPKDKTIVPTIAEVIKRFNQALHEMPGTRKFLQQKREAPARAAE